MNKIQENSVLMRLSFGRPGNRRKGDLSAVQTDADKSRLRLSKVLFTGDEFAAVGTFDGKLTSWVNSRAINVETGLRGVTILPRGLLGDVDARMSAAVGERARLVESFLSVYDAERERARERLNGQFRERDYPDAATIRGRFSLRWSYLALGVADGLPPEVELREREKLAESFDKIGAEVRDALRVGLSDLVGHLADKLTPGPDGKRKIFRDSAVRNLVEFLELFKARDVTNDRELAALAERAQGIIDGVSPDALRGRPALAASVSEGLAAVKAGVSDLIAVQPSRRFNLDD